jgi:hypothetical protein
MAGGSSFDSCKEQDVYLFWKASRPSRMRLFENMALRRIFGPKREKVIGS